MLRPTATGPRLGWQERAAALQTDPGAQNIRSVGGRGGHWEQERKPYLLIYYLTLLKTFKNHHQSRQNKHFLLTKLKMCHQPSYHPLSWQTLAEDPCPAAKPRPWPDIDTWPPRHHRLTRPRPPIRTPNQLFLCKNKTLPSSSGTFQDLKTQRSKLPTPEFERKC